uniref:ATP synthase complex subunit 8 n=1 Tax=Geocapromys ingrahami TaxID=1543403 RepID=A0A6H0DRI7_9HYST|nr:ATP synthase F0 subunit 8 [Geocapromys ingrahami]QIS91898.1 ATP synthase F0 subunit 8 [Geocapromys ingrahami]QIS91924.1 ATP synthase F0 subunit 8 [Geocapromys ingrahami]QIS91950.1 ATP synthase F0 subunit 8 [Geocapromys ingrahami]
MPQLDTSTWLINILSMLFTLLVIFQLKTLTHQYPYNPQLTSLKQKKQKTPWEMKWTKTYLPLS